MVVVHDDKLEQALDGMELDDAVAVLGNFDHVEVDCMLEAWLRNEALVDTNAGAQHKYCGAHGVHTEVHHRLVEDVVDA